MLRKIVSSSLILTVVLIVLSCKSGKQEFSKSLELSVSNTAKVATGEVPVILSIKEIKADKPDFNPKAYVVLENKSEIPSQVNYLDGDTIPDELVFLASFDSMQTKQFTIAYNTNGTVTRTYIKRTQAILSVKTGGEWKDRKYIGGNFTDVQFLKVPPEHTDHSGFIRFEGPGWESDKIAYRFYLDWRNANDIFGKIIDTMVLQNVGQAGLDSYHDLSGWGMDIFKVGESLGIGSMGMYYQNKVNMVSVTDSVTSRIVLNGPVESMVETKYYGWKVGDKKYNLTSDLSIYGGSRITVADLTIDNPEVNLCTGIIANDSVMVFTNYDHPDGDYIYYGTWGKQSLHNDSLGLAVFVRKEDLLKITSDKLNHILVFKSGATHLRYYFAAAWEKEPGGITNAQEFKTYLVQSAEEITNGLTSKFK